MTGNDGERRKTSIWPWVAGLLAIALLLWAFAEMLTSQ